MTSSTDFFSTAELQRYSRQILLPGFGEASQQKLKAAKVLVIGAGGLGSPVLLYLSAAGVGNIGIVDFDLVEASNLQRQILFTTEDIGKIKAAIAAERIKSLNPHINVFVFNEYINASNALKIFADYDVVIDGTDNLPTRYLCNDACVLLNKPLIYGAIFQFEGQASVFNELMPDGNRSPNYRDLFPVPPPPEMVPSCAEGGVLGVLPGMIGSIMANETIKVITGIGQTLSGRLLLFDALNFSTHYVKIAKQSAASEIKELIDYEEFCNPKSAKEHVLEILPLALKEVMTMQAIQIIDVREPFEFELSNIGGLNIPLNDMADKVLPEWKSQRLVMVCKSGARSRKAAMQLSALGFTNVASLSGGLLRWRDDVDPAMEVF